MEDIVQPFFWSHLFFISSDWYFTMDKWLKVDTFCSRVGSIRPVMKACYPSYTYESRSDSAMEDQKSRECCGLIRKILTCTHLDSPKKTITIEMKHLNKNDP